MTKTIKRIKLRSGKDRSKPTPNVEKKPLGIVCTCVGFRGICCKLRQMNETPFEED